METIKINTRRPADAPLVVRYSSTRLFIGRSTLEVPLAFLPGTLAISLHISAYIVLQIHNHDDNIKGFKIL